MAETDPRETPTVHAPPATVPIAPEVAAQIAAQLVDITTPHTAGTAGGAPPTVEGTGAELGRYRLLEELGHGGMGVVYRARDDSLGRDVALKVLLVRGRVQPEVIDRFQREARAAAVLEHPHIIRVLDVGTLPSGLPFYTMELLHGTDLAQAIAAGGLPLRRTAEAVRQVADALAYAHQKGVLHRDVKPQNIFLRRSATQADEVHALLLDFGLAKLTEHDFSPEAVDARKGRSLQGLTQTGQMLGTPAYMAPEQARGTREVDARADVYALGAALYHGIAGRPPFEAATLAELLDKVHRADPAPPSRANGEVDADLDTLVLRCLQKDPKDRYATAGELAEDLRRWIAGEPISARPIGTLGRVWRRAKRNRAVAIPIAALSLLLVLGLAAWTGIAVRDRVRLRRSIAESEALLAARKPDAALAQLAVAQVLAPEDCDVRRLAARIQVARGRAAKEAYLRARDDAERLDREAAADTGIPADATEEKVEALRAAAWKRVEDRKEAQRLRGESWSAALRPFQEALSEVSDDPDARRELAEMYWDEYLRAERTRERADEARYRKLVEDSGGPEFVDRVRGARDVRVTFLLPNEFAGATMTAYLFRYTQAPEPPVLVPVPFDPVRGEAILGAAIGAWKPLPLEIATRPSEQRRKVRWGSAYELPKSERNRLALACGRETRPFARFEVRLPRGSYLLWIPPGQGVYETRYPIEVTRDREWDETCEVPSESGPPLPLTMDAVQGASATAYWVHLPAGPLVVGGDREAPMSPARTEAWVRSPEKGSEGVFIARFEVTSAMYRAYLDDSSWHTAEEAFLRVPRQTTVPTEASAYWVRGEHGFHPVPALTWWTDEIAVVAISWRDAMDYCGWLTKRVGGGAWRFDLPTEDEWEKAARGPSARYFPWGDVFDISFCRCYESRAREKGDEWPEPFGLFPVDEGPFGVRDLAGGVREWTSTCYGSPESWRLDKGGSFGHPSTAARSAGRTANAPEDSYPSLGFRLVARRAER